jgi:hypothetical protein
MAGRLGLCWRPLAAQAWPLAHAAGAELFECLLLDHDVGVNYVNWNYFAGIGNDPRNRHFKTVTQVRAHLPVHTTRTAPGVWPPQPEQRAGLGLFVLLHGICDMYHDSCPAWPWLGEACVCAIAPTGSPSPASSSDGLPVCSIDAVACRAWHARHRWPRCARACCCCCPVQGMQYDEDALLIGAWLPQLACLPPPLRHQPFAMTPQQAASYGVQLGRDYPLPMVDPQTQIGMGPAKGPKTKAAKRAAKAAAAATSTAS